MECHNNGSSDSHTTSCTYTATFNCCHWEYKMMLLLHTDELDDAGEGLDF